MQQSSIIYQATFILVILIAILLFGFIFWLAVLNRSSQQSYELIKPIVGGIAVALFFLMSSFLSPLPYSEYNTDVLVLAKNEDEIVPLQHLTVLRFGAKPSCGYEHIYSENLAFKHQTSEKKSDFLAKKNNGYFLDLVEWATFTWIAQNYPKHWQVERSWFSGISGGGGSVSVSKNAYKKTTKINLPVLLKGNKFAEVNKDKEIYVYLPENTKATYKKINESYHVITLKNKNMNLTISFTYKGGGQLGATELAEQIKERYSSGWTHHISINFKMNIKRLRRWSILTKQEKEWIEELSDFYNDSFSWYKLKDRIEKVLL